MRGYLPPRAQATPALNRLELPQDLLDVRPLDLLERLLERKPLDQAELHVGDRLAVAQLHARHEQVAHVKDAAPYLGYAAVDVAERVDGLHARAHGVLRGEDGVARRFGKLADEGKVDRAVGHHVGAITRGARHEERRDVGHHDRHRVGMVRGEFDDAVLRDAHVVEPLLTDLLAGAVAHGFFHVVAGLVGEKSVYPDAQLVLGLVAELLLAVERPAHEPVGVGAGNDAAGDHVAGEGVALADCLDVRRDLAVEGRHRGAHPLGLLGISAESVGAAEAGVLSRDAAPHVPAAAGGELGSPRGGPVLRPHGGVLNAAAVGDEDEIVLGEVDDRGHTGGVATVRSRPAQHDTANVKTTIRANASRRPC